MPEIRREVADPVSLLGLPLSVEGAWVNPMTELLAVVDAAVAPIQFPA